MSSAVFGRLPANRLAHACVLVICGALAGCAGSLLETDLPAAAVYVLTPEPSAQSVGQSVGARPAPVDLSIGAPEAAPGLDTSRIAVVNGARLDYYRGASWGASAASIVQMFLLESLENQHLFRSVTADPSRVAGQYLLDVELRDFQAEYTRAGEPPSAHVKIVGRLIRVADRRFVGSIVAESVQPASADRMHAVVAAFEAAAQKAAIDLGQQVAAAIGGDAGQ